MELKPLESKVSIGGIFTEIFKLPDNGQVSCLAIDPGETRGNHYHVRKTEHFAVLQGAAEIQVKNRETGNVMKVSLSGNSPMVATILPNHTHNITATLEGCLCIIWCDEQYNEADPDTFKEEI